MFEQQMPAVFVVDDDDAVRRSLFSLLSGRGFTVETYASGREFLAMFRPDRGGCILLELQMPEMDGFSVLDALRQSGSHASVVFMTADGDVPTAVKAIKAGAYDLLEKPLEPEVVLDRIQRCMTERAGHVVSEAELRRRCKQLSGRERDVMRCLVEGLSNKRIGQRLGISPRTVETHRAHVMEKTGARSLSELVRLAIAGGLA